jgi:hypothetical protein
MPTLTDTALSLCAARYDSGRVKAIRLPCHLRPRPV